MQLVERPLLRRAEVQADVVDRREDEQIVRADGFGQARGGKVLVDDGVHAVVVPVRVAHDGHTAAAAGDDNLTGIRQSADTVDLYDIFRLRCGYDTTITAIHFDHVVSLLFFSVSFFLGHDTTDDFDRFVEGVIVWIYNNLGQNGGNRTVDATVEKFFTNGVLQVISDITLAHGRADRYGCEGVIRVLLSEFVHSSMDHTHLWGITVGNNNLAISLYKICNSFCGAFYCVLLLGKGSTQRFVPEGNDNFFLAHDGSSFL